MAGLTRHPQGAQGDWLRRDKQVAFGEVNKLATPSINTVRVKPAMTVIQTSQSLHKIWGSLV